MLATPKWATSLRAMTRACTALALAGSLTAVAYNASAQTQAATAADTTPTASIGALHELDIVGFEGAFNLPVWVAQQEGFFAAHGLKVDLSYPSNSVQVIRKLTDGSAQMSLMSIDNVLAYRRAQGEKGEKGAEP